MALYRAFAIKGYYKRKTNRIFFYFKNNVAICEVAKLCRGYNNKVLLQPLVYLFQQVSIKAHLPLDIYLKLLLQYLLIIIHFFLQDLFTKTNQYKVVCERAVRDSLQSTEPALATELQSVLCNDNITQTFDYIMKKLKINSLQKEVRLYIKSNIFIMTLRESENQIK